MTQSSSNPFTIQIAAAAQASGLPAWVPPAGYFADVPMQNNPADLLPAIYADQSQPMNNPFVIWGGSAWLRDYSSLGAQIYYAGGHEAATTLPNIQMSLACDFTSLRWSIANLPLAPNIANTFVNGYAADGTPYCPHTYLGLEEMPAAWGGASKGSLLSFFWAGSTWPNRINVLDVSKPQLGYSQLTTTQSQNADPTRIRFTATGDGGNYPITVMDEANGGWWALVDGSIQYTLFVAKNGTITQYPALGGNLQNGSLVLAPSLNLLIALDGGYISGSYASTSYRNLYIRNLVTGNVTTSQTLGNVPSLTNGYDGGANNFHRPDVLGLQWVEELGCIVGLDQSGAAPVVVKLTPPASNPDTAQWTWSSIGSLQHWPQDSNGQTTLQTCLNGYWAKFRWIPSLHAFVFCTEQDRKPQIIKLN